MLTSFFSLKIEYLLLKYHHVRLQVSFDMIFGGAQWLSWLSIRLGIKGLLVWVSPPVESLCSILEQGTLSAAKYWFNLRRYEIF